MAQTMIEKILSNHAGTDLRAGDISDIEIDARIARDFGGANVVKNLEENGLSVHDPGKTYFTFDCNPGGSDQKYATNQQRCRQFARANGVAVFDIDSGIGTHVAIDKGLIVPGGTLVSTDSHANILGAVGAFGQGMGDKDIAAAWANGSVWFKVPKSMKVVLKGELPEGIYAKDLTLRLLQEFGAAGLLGYAAEFYGPVVDRLGLSDRVTIASMATEMGGIIILFPPNDDVIAHFERVTGGKVDPVCADEGATYEKEVEVDVSGLRPMISRPGHPEDATDVDDEAGRKIDSAFVGSCTNGRYEDLKIAADILRDRKVAPGVVLKIVPSTREMWQRCLDDGLIDVFMKAGALVGNSGCAGCAAGQIGQNGPGEVTISTGNRNFAGKQGKGEVYLASPATVAASAISGVITTEDNIKEEPVLFDKAAASAGQAAGEAPAVGSEKPGKLTGRVWVVDKDNIDTDMIFHNRYLAITDIDEMGQYTFDNLEGWEDFAKKAKPGDIVVTGANFGAGSSRQQAVDCFASLGVQAVVAKSFGSIYERNAINSGFPIVVSDLVAAGIEDGEEITVDLSAGEITRNKPGDKIAALPFPEIQLQIYRKGGLLNI
jgi:homoaconitate hydratase family protein/3-isopropylmalate dehydratase small subunit